ncbi:hypothetical protein SPICUR_07455 [Spiribacter curvatus]|uniref:Uncharacterized protein n=1 Tax=Spiribacter curvatus TaxID=1335757 RepID=U5T7T9_9GAMM|nr:hypothetical protein SPICUR_07455 [Spiribacter curvatus]
MQEVVLVVPRMQVVLRGDRLDIIHQEVILEKMVSSFLPVLVGFLPQFSNGDLSTPAINLYVISLHAVIPCLMDTGVELFRVVPW